MQINLRLSENSNSWYLSKVNLAHTHELLEKSEISTIVNSKVNDQIDNRVRKWVSLKLPKSSILKLLDDKLPLFEHRVNPRPLDNLLNKLRQETSSYNSKITMAQQLVKELDELKQENNFWVYEYNLNEENVLQNVMWMSPEGICLWEQYSDVILNDCTACTNRFKLPLSTWCIVDNNNKTRIVAAAFMASETTEDHEWVMRCIQKNTTQSPVVIITDHDPAVELAITSIFSGTIHHLCIYHIVNI
jgi:hypothetical protein